MDQPQRSFELISKSQGFPLPFQFSKIKEINSHILDELILSPNHQYAIRSNVTPEHLTAFINYLVSDEVPNINNNNFNDFSQLSHEFGIPIVQNSIFCSPYGFLKHLLNKTNGNILDEINITASGI